MSWNDKRPMSPHLQVYKLPLTAYVSISHRVAGVVNTVAIVLLVYVLAKAAGSPEGFDFAGALLGSWFGKFVLFGFTLSLYYHLCNGVRHLFWDVGQGFDVAVADKTAKVTIAAAVALTVITWVVGSAS